MKQYQDLLRNIIDNGVEKESGRANMPNTIGISHATIKMDLSEGFPLLTTKKMYWKGIVHELLWFLRGETNIKYLVDNNVNIWNQDAYRWYLKWWDEYGCEIENTYKFETIEEFVNEIKTKTSNKLPTFGSWHKRDNQMMNIYKLGDLGKVYGHQWRNQNGVDQIKDVLDGLKNNPYSRYHIIDGWNKADFPEMALPPCHLLYQFIVRPLTTNERYKYYYDNISNNNVLRWASDERQEAFFNENNVPKFYLDLNMYQRSVDTACGAPFNLASMSLLLMIFAKASNMVAGISNWTGGDTHIYVDHIPIVKEQLKREPFPLPKMKINKELNCLDDILALTIDDFELVDYECHPPIKFELFVGLKKT